MINFVPENILSTPKWQLLLVGEVSISNFVKVNFIESHRFRKSVLLSDVIWDFVMFVVFTLVGILLEDVVKGRNDRAVA